MNTITQQSGKSILIMVFILITSVSFSQNANLVVIGKGNIISNNDMSPITADNTDYGIVSIGSTLDHTFTLRNTGSGGSNKSRRIIFSNPSVTITGANPGQFSIISGPLPGNILNGQGTIFFPGLVIRFTPTLPAGKKNATVTIRYTNNGGQLTYIFAIQGTSAASPEINIQGNAISITDGDNTPSIADGTDFSSTSVGTPITKTFTIQNTGSGNLTIGAITFTGINAADFTLTTPPNPNVISGGSTSFVVKFNPGSSGTKTAGINIVNNDSNENPYNFTLLGTANIKVFFDSDGDGVNDDVDLDDDNDGIRDTVEETNCKNCNGSRVNYKFLNETFGAGTRTTLNSTNYCYEDGISSPNTISCPTLADTDLNEGEYTVGPSAQISSKAFANWYRGSDHTGNRNGRMAIFNAAYIPNTFYTATISGTLPKIPLTYSFWVINLDRTDVPGINTRIRPNIRVEIRDQSNTLLSTINTGDIAPTAAGDLYGTWHQFTLSTTLNVSSFKVIFINNNPGSLLGNDFALDDIEISQTLCDLDKDGVADALDLDSENDGIPDVIEVGFGNLSNGKGKIETGWSDANGNGLYDGAEGLTVLLDSDNDGRPNYMDLDSDNDSVFDVDESGAGNINAAIGFINGDGDITGDAVGDGNDSETFRKKDTNGDGILEGYGDGILDLYDYGKNIYGNLNQGKATSPFLDYILDTDGDGIQDYIDVKSDGVNFDISKTLYASLDANNNGIIDGTTDIDKDGITDTFDTKTNYFGSPRDLNRKLLLAFDGRNDYAQSSAILGGMANATLMAWINLNSAFITDGVIVGQDKFQLRINSSKKLEAVVNGAALNSKIVLNSSQWYHVAAVYDGNLLKLYLNGTLVSKRAVSGNIGNDLSLLTIGRNPSANNKFFKGKIDEVRVFSGALTDIQVQRMVYQEIQNNQGQIRGTIIPKNIGALPFVKLLRYYRMDVYKDDIIDDLTTVPMDLGSGMKIYNHKNIYPQQAPMPFITERKGNFATAVNSPTKEIRGMDIMDYDWSIVNVKHHITETSNSVDLGLILDSGIDIIMNNDTKLQNDWYLKLDGRLDLQGRSQLLQTSQSDLDPLSTGFLERDQQGTRNIYNYNYWSSPVGPINGITNNNNCTVSGICKDGTNPSKLLNINWVAGYDGAPGIPISLAGFWIYKFQNVSNNYANWTQISETGSLSPGQGYTLKGSGAAGTGQNYTFLGKPFNGRITNPIAANNLNLSGNPYASALDANAFINDNSSSLTGTLYFWEHYPTNNSHNLAEYQGGYATRNLTGGTAPVAPALISGLGSSSRIPGRFIPVGQGFFVQGNATGGNIVFNNSHRAFVKENNANSNVMFKGAELANAEDPYEEDIFAKIRIGYTSQDNFHRQILLGFMDEKASSGLDYGYDALIFDQQTNDISFIVGTSKLIIQGDSYFNEKNVYPLFVNSNVAGTVKFMVDDLENFPPEQAIYIYDAESNTYNDIRNEMFETEIPIGEIANRFSLRFVPEILNTKEEAVSKFNITHIQNGNTLIINNQLSDVSVQKIALYSILGQPIKTWNIINKDQQIISIPIQNVSTGTYIAKVETNNGSFNKKIIIK